MTKIEAAYLAGLLDGEGCFLLQKFRTERSPIGFQYRTVVELVMCDLSTIEYVKSISDRETIQERKLKSGRTAYKLIWYNSHAAAVIREILPFLRGKKEQAAICLHFEDHITPGRGRTYSQDDKITCEAVHQKLKDLKKVVALRC